MLDVIGIGKPVKDLLIAIDEMPPQDGAALAKCFSSQSGGKVASAMVAAARLGMKAGMYAVLGDDAKGRFCVEDFQRHGVDVSHIELRPGKTSPYCLSIAEKKNENRRFIGDLGTSGMLEADALDLAYLASARLLHLENGDPASLRAARFAKEHGITVAMDADTYSPAIEAMEPYVDLFIASAFYVKGRFKDATLEEGLEQIAARGCKVVIFTLGSRGCIGYAEGKHFSLPAFSGLQVVDTTGAGDVFHGGYITAWLLGQSPEECARFASAVSYIKCTRLGGRAGIPTREMVDYFLAHGTLPEKTDLDERSAFYASLVT